MKASLEAVGSYAPRRIINNSFFEDKVDTTNKWIIERTGIVQRRYALETEFTSDLCLKAAQTMLREHPEIELKDVDFIIVSTTTADHTIPNVSSKLQHMLRISRAGCIDISAACSGFVYGLIMAKGLIEGGLYKKILVFGGDTLSKITDFTDRETCILYGDAAGVALVQASDTGKLLNFTTGTEGNEGNAIYRSTLSNTLHEKAIKADSLSHIEGRRVYKWAVSSVVSVVNELLALSKTALSDVDHIILHSANLRITEAVASRLGYPIERMPQSISMYGNTSSGSVPLSLHHAIKRGIINPGERIFLIGYGGGLSYAGLELIV